MPDATKVTAYSPEMANGLHNYPGVRSYLNSRYNGVRMSKVGIPFSMKPNNNVSISRYIGKHFSLTLNINPIRLVKERLVDSGQYTDGVVRYRNSNIIQLDKLSGVTLEEIQNRCYESVCSTVNAFKDEYREIVRGLFGHQIQTVNAVFSKLELCWDYGDIAPSIARDILISYNIPFQKNVRKIDRKYSDFDNFHSISGGTKQCKFVAYYKKEAKTIRIELRLFSDAIEDVLGSKECPTNASTLRESFGKLAANYYPTLIDIEEDRLAKYRNIKVMDLIGIANQSRSKKFTEVVSLLADNYRTCVHKSRKPALLVLEKAGLVRQVHRYGVGYKVAPGCEGIFQAIKEKILGGDSLYNV